MCYGRYDNWRHPLRDKLDSRQCMWPGDDYYNPAAAQSVSTSRYCSVLHCPLLGRRLLTMSCTRTGRL